ncbi:MAG TPA: hypothetical protein VI731_12640 [Bacteroidia bacterium]|nr:hypothetical protein [Bacteroidia bacterium]
MKKIIVIGLWAITLTGLVVVMSFAARSHETRVCTKLNIEISRKCADLFITEESMQQLLQEHDSSPEGKALAYLDVAALENLFLSHPAVEECNVFTTVAGEVNIRLLQRKPIARLINQAGESYYIDDKGLLMPWSDQYTAPVLVVNGSFNETYGAFYQARLGSVSIDSTLKSVNLLDDIWQIAKRVEADSFLRAQIVQCHITPQREFMLIPRIGDHSILFGNAADADEKFEKLIIFYREGLNRSGRWNDYSMISLQFKNQVVCTKKKNSHGI